MKVKGIIVLGSLFLYSCCRPIVITGVQRPREITHVWPVGNGTLVKIEGVSGTWHLNKKYSLKDTVQIYYIFWPNIKRKFIWREN